MPAVRRRAARTGEVALAPRATPAPQGRSHGFESHEVPRDDHHRGEGASGALPPEDLLHDRRVQVAHPGGVGHDEGGLPEKRLPELRFGDLLPGNAYRRESQSLLRPRVPRRHHRHGWAGRGVGVHDGDPPLPGLPVQQDGGPEVVHGVDHDTESREEVVQPPEPLVPQRLHSHPRVDVPERVPGGLGLPPTERVGGGEHLSVQVGDLEGVDVGDSEAPDSGPHQGLEGRAPHSARSQDQEPRAGEPGLVPGRQEARVPVRELVVGHARRRRPHETLRVVATVGRGIRRPGMSPATRRSPAALARTLRLTRSAWVRVSRPTCRRSSPRR